MSEKISNYLELRKLIFSETMQIFSQKQYICQKLPPETIDLFKMHPKDIVEKARRSSCLYDMILIVNENMFNQSISGGNITEEIKNRRLKWLDITHPAGFEEKTDIFIPPSGYLIPSYYGDASTDNEQNLIYLKVAFPDSQNNGFAYVSNITYIKNDLLEYLKENKNILNEYERLTGVDFYSAFKITH